MESRTLHVIEWESTAIFKCSNDDFLEKNKIKERRGTISIRQSVKEKLISRKRRLPAERPKEIAHLFFKRDIIKTNKISSTPFHLTDENLNVCTHRLKYLKPHHNTRTAELYSTTHFSPG